MALTEVRHVLVDARKLPRTGVRVTARLYAPNGYIVGTNQEIVEEVTEVTGPTGLVSLWLTPQSEIEYVGSVYEITWRGQDKPRYVSVPNTGPVNLRNILASPPDLGGGGTVIAGRGITSTAVVAGKLIVTYTDGTTQDAGTVNPGPAGTNGAPGAQGPAGTGNTTVTGVTTRVAKVLAYLSGGATLFKRGRTTYDVVEDYGADPTNVADSSAAFLACIADANAVTNGATVEIPAGLYKIDTASRLTVLGTTSVRGDGVNTTTIRFTHVDGGWNVGTEASPSFGAEFSGMNLSGDSVARNPLWIGHTNGRNYNNIRVGSTGWNAGWTADQKLFAAGIVILSAQNCIFQRISAQLMGHHGIVFDYGSGGHILFQTQVNDIGQLSASADARHVLIRQSVPAAGNIAAINGGGLHPTVYDRPTNLRFIQGYWEGANNTQAAICEVGDVESVFIMGVRFSASSRYPDPVPAEADYLAELKLGALSKRVIAAECHFQGNTAAAGPTKVVTGVYVAAGAAQCGFGGQVNLFNLGVGMYLETTAAKFNVPEEPSWPSSVIKSGGPGARGVNNGYTIQGGAAGAPTPSVEYLGVRYQSVASGTGTYDTELICLRRGGAYVWVDVAGQTAITTLTHVDGVDVVVNSSLGRQFQITAVGNVNLGLTTNNTGQRMTMLNIIPGAVARTISFTTTGTGAFAFTSGFPGPTLTVPANKTAVIGWQYDATLVKNRLLTSTVDV